LLKASSNSRERKNAAKYFLNWGTICPPHKISTAKLYPRLTARKIDGLWQPHWNIHYTTAGNSMPLRRLGDGKYNNQQRMGLGGKVGNGGQLVAAVDGTLAVALAA
jgi:hypothetical protein